MPKDEWGVKRLCPTCATRFYDLQNDPMTCPSCDETFDLASLTGGKSRGTSPDKADKSAVVDEAEDATDEVDVLDEDDSEDADVDLGDDVLEEDDDDTVNLEEIADMPAPEDES